jgi:hypothetical protein
MYMSVFLRAVQLLCWYSRILGKGWGALQCCKHIMRVCERVCELEGLGVECNRE